MPGTVPAAALAGLARAARLRVRDPATCQRIGRITFAPEQEEPVVAFGPESPRHRRSR
ncbi:MULTISPECIES: hypothetical protein [Amycolatopsis]|uniref:Uncharacterized protein n=1 Tax=Amycolatopsis albidoflavus TaxID=102226 RepID=A0ABW5HTI6_9PSEU